jgi:arylsulfatase
MIASWKNHIKQGSSTDHLSAFQDILPTVLELCSIQPPKETDGISFLNILLGGEQEDKHEYLYWEIPEYGGQQALRIDNFKAIRKNIFKGNLNIQLFDLSTDIQENNNVAEQFPEIVKQAKEIMDKEHRPSVLPGFQFPALGE